MCSECEGTVLDVYGIENARHLSGDLDQIPECANEYTDSSEQQMPLGALAELVLLIQTSESEARSIRAAALQNVQL